MPSSSLDSTQTDPHSLVDVLGKVDASTQGLDRTTQNYARTIAQAFTGAVAGGKKFDDVLKSLALRLSNMAVQASIKPIAGNVAGGIEDILGSLFGGVKPFASGGVVATPTYFPLGGGLGVAGEAGPEAILPLSRGDDGALGVRAAA